MKNVFLGTKQIALIKLNEANILPEKLYMAIKQELGRTNGSDFSLIISTDAHTFSFSELRIIS